MKAFKERIFKSEITIPDAIGGKYKLTQVAMYEVVVDGIAVDGAYVCFEDALAGFFRMCDRVGYLHERVTTFVDRKTREKLHNYWHVGIAADGFPLRPGVAAFQLALEVRHVMC